eukprot:TRINITY_DN2243_c0_g1_i8.p1 TRINITY_DN2243_c0_g1~~TRINITY_DN2243_c0_g1_i8.p1  ORF type:complete len:199 (+),score=79.76 TRINITY_DN2243_c0_g1_i8:71-667(+)
MQTIKNLQKSIKKTLKKVNNLKDNIVLSLKVREVSVLSKREVQTTNEEIPPPPPAPVAFVPCPQKLNIKPKVTPVVKKEEDDFQSELKKKIQQRTLVKDVEQVEVKAQLVSKSAEVTTPVVAPVKVQEKTPAIQLSLKSGDVPPPPPPPPAVAVPKRTVTTQQPMKREPAAKVIQNLDLISELKNVQMRKRQPIPVNM